MVEISSGRPQPHLLQGIVGFVEGAKHPIGDSAKVIAVLFEQADQRIGSAHSSPFQSGVRQGGDEPTCPPPTEGHL